MNYATSSLCAMFDMFARSVNLGLDAEPTPPHPLPTMIPLRDIMLPSNKDICLKSTKHKDASSKNWWLPRTIPKSLPLGVDSMVHLLRKRQQLLRDHNVPALRLLYRTHPALELVAMPRLLFTINQPTP
jgi:hypothetical protein